MNELQRFFASQHSWPGESENEEQYTPSQTISAFGAAPTANLAKFPRIESGGHRMPPEAVARWLYNRPSGPTTPADLLRQAQPGPTAKTWLDDEVCGRCGGGGDPGGNKDLVDALANTILHADRPGHIDEPVIASQVVQCNQVPQVVSDGAWVTLVSYRTERGYVQIIKKYGVDAPPAAFTDIQFRWAIDGIPIHGLTNIRCQQGTIQAPTDINVRALEQELLQLQALKLSPGNVSVSGLMSGYEYAAPKYTGDSRLYTTPNVSVG